MTVTIDDIRAAADLIEGRVLRTPSFRSEPLSVISGAHVVLKLENLQYTSSFKPRGALVKLLSLSDGEKKAGVVAASAGNHAQGVAFHAQNLGIPATIYMPVGTPFTKVGRTESMGADVVLEGEGLKEARENAQVFADTNNKIFIHPYDDEKIIAGQGTVGLEMLTDHPDLDCLLLPIGGGGLMAGSAIAAKALKPDIEIIGVEASAYPSMKCAINGQADTSGGQTIAEGIAVKVPGELTRPIIEKLISDVLLVEESELENAVQTYIETQRLIVEGAGAATLAALLGNKERFKGRRVGLVVSGGNIDSRLLSSILMRGLVREGRLVRLRIGITDAPGVLAKVTGLIGECGGNIVEVYHQRLFQDIPVKLADVDVVIETLDARHVAQIIAGLENSGFRTRQLGGMSMDNNSG
ncbi:MAG: threonine ammonia-lyase [Rhodospirillaceae bacterium]|nr:threonine ammonia-lyase [Rhodospirillaceae bacterium]